MKLSQIATLLNDTIVPNIFGGDENGYTIAEDLRNVVELGTRIADMDADTLKDYMKKFAIGVIDNFMDTKSYKAETYGIFLNSIEYGGALQRTRARLLKATDTPILTLENYNENPSAPDYNDGHFYGTTTDSILFTKDYAFMICYSVPVEMFKKSFTSANDVMKLVTLIESNANNTLTNELNALAKGMLRKLALACSTDRKIPLITTYNTEFGFTSGDAGFVTLANWKNDTNFKLWCEEVVINLKKYVQEMNNKYNDGTVETFTNAEDIRTVLLTEFSTALDFAQSSVYHNELTNAKNGEYYTINYWQNGAKELLPTMGANSVHDEIIEKIADSGSSQTATLSHVVGLIYDKYGLFSSTKLNKTTVDYIAKGDFNTMYHHVVKSANIDLRDSGILLTME